MAVLLAALIAGLWYFLRGRKEKRTPETPQTVTLLEPQRAAGQTRHLAQSLAYGPCGIPIPDLGHIGLNSLLHCAERPTEGFIRVLHGEGPCHL
jgi:hypothetical protein